MTLLLEEVAGTTRYEVGARCLIEPYLNDSGIKAIVAFREWLDNSLDAGATQFRITLKDSTLIVADNGNGCSNPSAILMFGASHAHSKNRRSGRFGMGGKISNLRLSQGTRTEATTTHDGLTYVVISDWKRQLDTDCLELVTREPRVARHNEAGTTIRNFNCRSFSSKPAKLIEQIGFDYSDAIHAGISITLDLRGEVYQAKPYSPPKFTDRVDFEFLAEAGMVHGYCGIVDPSIKNEHGGWAIHWGPHRVLTTTVAPADGKYCGRLEGHVWLPEGWRNVNLTKDDFAEEPEELFAEIGRLCERIIEAASHASTEYDFAELKSAVEAELNDGITLPVAAKGYRPGTAGKKGTVTPTGNGSPHKKFNIWQPGNRGTARAGTSIPQRYEFHAEDLGDEKFRVQMNRGRNPVAHITLSTSHKPFRRAIESGDVNQITLVCPLVIAAHLAINRGEQPLMGFVEEMDFHDIYSRLTAGSSQDPDRESDG